jgi:leucyl-tRNA synthetase
MSKSKGNVVDPDDMVTRYGADALRLYVMFVAPPEKEVEWSDSGVEGSFRFLVRVWRLVDHWAGALPAPSTHGVTAYSDVERGLRRKTHDTIRRVTMDIEERMHLNTAVSSLMELVNELYAFGEATPLGLPSRAEAGNRGTLRPATLAVAREAVEALVRMIAPFAPHTAEELWERLGHRNGLTRASWPTFDPEVARAEEVIVPVQINGGSSAPDLPRVFDNSARTRWPRRRVRSHTDGQDDTQSRCREGSARQRRGLVGKGNHGEIGLARDAAAAG